MKYPLTESSQLEFKEDFPENQQLLKTLIAFCNTLGGRVIIGVSNDGTIKGIDELKAHVSLEWLDKMIYESTTPPIIPLVHLQCLEDKLLLIIDVSSGMNKPYYKTSAGLSEGTYVRLGRSTMKANADTIEELKWQSRGISYDRMPIYHASIQDLSPSLLQHFLGNRRNQKKVNVSEETMFAYHLIITEHGKTYPTVGGILCFSENPQQYLSESYVLCTHFSGTSGRNVLATRQINGTLFEQFDAAYDFILSRLNKSFVITGKHREESFELPPVAIRETLMNAIVHRNYHIPSPIKIAIYENRIEFFSPGNFFGPINLATLELGMTYTRNIGIAKILWEAKYIEKMGSGLIEIFDSYRNAGLLKPEITEGTNYIKCVLPRIKQIKDEETLNAKVLNFIKMHDKVSRAILIQQLNIPRATVGRILQKLLADKSIIRHGKGAGTYYTNAPIAPA